MSVSMQLDGDSPAAESRRTSGSALTSILWAGLATSILGDYLYRVGLTWFVAAGPHGAERGAWLGTAMALPVAVFGLFGGALVDRFSRPKTMLVTDLIRLLILAQLGLMLAVFHPPLVLILACAALLAASGICFTPALQSWMPDLVGGRDRLVRFDATMLTTINALGVAGPAIAGLLFPAVGATALILLDGATFGASAAAVWYVMRAKPDRPAAAAEPASAGSRPGIVRRSAEGLRYVFSQPVLRPQFTIFPFMECVSYGILFLLPSFLAQRGYHSSWLFGSLLAAGAGGRVLGGLLVSRTALRRRRGWVMATNHLGQGLALAVFCLVPSPIVALPVFALMGLPAGATQIALSSWVQTAVDRQLRGRAFGALTSFVTWLMPLGPVIYGGLGAWRSPWFAMVVAAGSYAVGGAYICAHRAVRRVR
jgi:MFS family permease